MTYLMFASRLLAVADVLVVVLIMELETRRVATDQRIDARSPTYVVVIVYVTRRPGNFNSPDRSPPLFLVKD